jgi:23S rRNA G2069 N7-methylase RlmK/C1962 C5-methylase RlmI
MIEEKTAEQAQMLANRVKKRLKHLQKWAKRMNFEAFRLYDRDIPEIPLVLDMYGGIICGALYKRPYEKDPALEAAWLQAMREILAKTLEIPLEFVIIKQRERQRRTFGSRQSQYEKIAKKGLIREICEGNYKFKVNLTDYLDTGLFLDRRSLRALIGSQAAGKRVLNLFCHTASFSVYAAGGSAISTDSVDLSNTYLAWARENFVLNGFEDISHKLIRADVSAFIKLALKARRAWDMIILDPPAFSNSTMAQADFDLQRDYLALLTDCLGLLCPGGTLYFSASARSFKASVPEMEKTLGAKVVDISEEIVDEDFRGKKVPKTFQIS